MKKASKINKAVFPVAGLGTRFLPATKAIPKEMLPVVDKPLMQYAVQEAYDAGIRHMVFVTGRSKRAIEDHFDTSVELEAELEANKKQELLDLVRAIAPQDMSCGYVRQPRALGLGHAVLCAQPLVGDEPFAVLLPDDLMLGPDGGPSVLAQMARQFDETPTCIVAAQEVPREHVKRYGIVAGQKVNDRVTKVDKMVEKPDPDKAPSRHGRGRTLHPDARGVRDDPHQPARRGWRDPADRRHRAPDGHRRRPRLPVRGQALRLRQQGRLPGGHRGTRAEEPAGGPGLSRVSQIAKALT